MYKYTILAPVFTFRDRKIQIYFWMGDLLNSLLRSYEGISCKELRKHAVKFNQVADFQHRIVQNRGHSCSGAKIYVTTS